MSLSHIEPERFPVYPRCASCGLPHFSVAKSMDGVCLACSYFEVCRSEMLSMGDATEWLRERGLCAYCGEYGSEAEHVVPKSSRLPTYTLLACGECNRIAGGLVFRSFVDKRGHIHRELRRKYRRVLRMPEWPEEEMGELGYVLRAQIEVWERARQSVRRRLEWSWLQAFWEETL